MTKPKRKTRRSLPRRTRRAHNTRSIKGGKVPDRKQYIDFTFFKSGMNPTSSYQYFVMNSNPPIYENGIDLPYQIQGIEQELQAYSKNMFVVPAYKYRMKISSDHARTKDEKEKEDAIIDKKIKRLDDKKKKLEEKK